MNAVQTEASGAQIIVKMWPTIKSLEPPNLSIRIKSVSQILLRKTQEWWSGEDGGSCSDT